MTPPIWTLPPDLDRHDDKIITMTDQTWHLPRADFRAVRQNTTGRGVTVAILDTGDSSHPTLKPAKFKKSYIPGENVEDRNGHSTHCRGTIASQDEDIGIAPDADIEIYKVLSNRGSGSSAGIADATEEAISRGVDIISMSLGGGSSYSRQNQLIKKAMDRGIWVCIAAGNSGFNGSGNTIGWPARSGEGICVAALKRDFTPASFSSGGPQLLVASPGQDILSCRPGSGFVFMSGTSMATPFTAGIAALIISLMRSQGKPSYTGRDAIHKFFEINCKDLLAPGRDTRTGWGMFDTLSLITKLAKDTIRYV